MPKPTKMARDWQNGGMCKPFLAITPSQTAYLRASDYLVCSSALPPLPVMLSEAFYRHLPEQCRQQQSSAVDGTIPLSTFFTLLSLHCTAEAAAASSTLSSPSLHPLFLVFNRSEDSTASSSAAAWRLFPAETTIILIRLNIAFAAAIFSPLTLVQLFTFPQPSRLN